MTLIEFLLARIAEDEAAARQVPTDQTFRVESSTPDAEPWRAAHHYSRHGPARVLADCEAKRRIVELDEYDGGGEDGHIHALRSLASVYADHPDYDPAWRP